MGILLKAEQAAKNQHEAKARAKAGGALAEKPLPKLEFPSASHGRCAGRLGMIPCARRQRSERRRARSRFSAGVIK
jgi:hypothetical protein